MSNTFLRISNLKVNYGGIEAVKGINMEIPRGQIITLIGANGAGKSSVLRTISGLVKPNGGTISFEGEEITAKDPTAIVSKGITRAGGKKNISRPYGQGKSSPWRILKKGRYNRRYGACFFAFSKA